MMETPLPAPEREPRSRSLALLLAAPVLWAVYHVVAYLLVESACITGYWTRPTIAVVITILTLLALAAVVYIGFASYRRWRRGTDEGEGFLGLVSATFSVILALIILADGASLWVLGACG